MPVNSNSVALASDDALDDLLALVPPDAPFMLEVRHLGGALAHPQGAASAVGHRGALLNLFTSAYPRSSPAIAASAAQSGAGIINKLRPHPAGRGQLAPRPKAAREASPLRAVKQQCRPPPDSELGSCPRGTRKGVVHAKGVQ